MIILKIGDGEHVKTSGLYDRIIKQLDKVSAEVIEFREVRPMHCCVIFPPS